MSELLSLVLAFRALIRQQGEKGDDLVPINEAAKEVMAQEEKA